MDKKIILTFNATMAQLYQISNYFRETKGINVYFYNVRITTTNNVKCTTLEKNAELLISMMQQGGYAIINKESI